MKSLEKLLKAGLIIFAPLFLFNDLYSQFKMKASSEISSVFVDNVFGFKAGIGPHLKLGVEPGFKGFSLGLTGYRDLGGEEIDNKRYHRLELSVLYKEDISKENEAPVVVCLGFKKEGIKDGKFGFFSAGINFGETFYLNHLYIFQNKDENYLGSLTFFEASPSINLTKEFTFTPSFSTSFFVKSEGNTRSFTNINLSAALRHFQSDYLEFSLSFGNQWGFYKTNYSQLFLKAGVEAKFNSE